MEIALSSSGRKSLLFLIISSLLIFKVVVDPDLGWHLEVGRYIVENRAVPKTDIFSFSVPDYPYIYHSWLTEALLYKVYEAIGLWGVSIVYTLIGTVGYWFLVKSANLKNKKTYILSLFFIPIIIWTVQMRTQIVTFAGLSLLYCIFSTLNPMKIKISRLYVIGIFFLFALWVNMHGGFILGLLFLLLLIVNKWWEIIESDIVFNKKILGIKKLIVFPTAAILGTLITPYALRAYEIAFTIGTNAFNMQFNPDWGPLFETRFTGLEATTLFRGGFIYGLVFIILIFYKELKKNDFATIIFLFFLSLITRRYVLPLLIVLVPLFLKQITRYANLGIQYYKENSNSIQLPIYIALLSVFTVLIIFPIRNIEEAYYSYSSEKLYANSGNIIFDYPYGALEHMRKNGVPDRMLNFVGWGGYLEWKLPGTKVFIDGRMDSYFINGKPFGLDYLSMTELYPGWQGLMQKYNIQAVIGPPSWPIVQVLKILPEWEIEYEDEVSTIMVRR